MAKRRSMFKLCSRPFMWHYCKREKKSLQLKGAPVHLWVPNHMHLLMIHRWPQEKVQI
jgi:hypothetical protein